MIRDRWRAAALTVGTAALVLVAAACGVPGNSSFQRINPPPELATTTTSTSPTTRPPTSSTTIPPSTTAAPTTSTTSTTEAPTTSTNPVFSATLYFVTSNGLLTPITRQLASSAAQQVLTELADGVPVGEEYGGLTTAIPVGSPLVVTIATGLATVELPPTFLTDTLPQNQTIAVAQIVLTLTARPGIGQVRFMSNNEPQEVLRPDGGLTDPDDVVACEDYSEMLAAGAAACG